LLFHLALEIFACCQKLLKLAIQTIILISLSFQISLNLLNFIEK
jgi:hypothetical protein